MAQVLLYSVTNFLYNGTLALGYIWARARIQLVHFGDRGIRRKKIETSEGRRVLDMCVCVQEEDARDGRARQGRGGREGQWEG